jgi:tetratricopeptide (TPR) repeat protein
VESFLPPPPAIGLLLLKLQTALSVFLLLRRYARTDLPQDAVSAFDLALQLPVGPKALSLQHQHHFMSLLICLLHRAFLGLYGAGGNTDLKFLRQTAQVVRRTVEHSSLDYDHRILFLMARSRARQLWFVRAMNVDYTLLSVALSRRDLLVAPTNGADCPICHGRRIALEFWNMSVSVTTPQASVMDAVIALMRDIRRGCPPGHHSAQGLDDALAHMLRSRCQLQYDASLHDEFLTVSMHSLLNNSSTKYSEVGTVMDLSTALLQRFQVSRNLDQLATAAQLCENALERLPPDYPKRAAVYHSGGAVYSVRYVHEGDVWLLKQAIHLQLQCIACTVADDAFRAERCRFLGVLLHMLYLKEGDSADLHGILTIIREVLVLRPDGHPDQAEACTELAAALLGFFEPSGCVPVLEEAIQLYEKALSLKPIGDRARARSCERLAEALCARHRAKGDVAALQRAVILRQEYLHLNSMPEADPLSRARAQCGLASTKTILDDASGSHVSEQECVALFLEALDVLPKEDSSHIFAVEELLSRAQSCFFRTGNLSLLDTAIRHGRQATLASPYQRHQNLSIRLAQTLQTRYGFLGQTADLDEAISLLRMFFAANPPTYSDRIGASCILAKSLRLEFERTGDVIRLDEAGSLLQKAYAICPEGHSQRRSICAHYAGLLRQQFHTHDTHDIVLIDRAIELCRESLRLIVAGDAGLSQSLNSLGTCFAMRFEVVKEMSSLDEAIQLFRKALELLPPSHTLRKDLCCNLGGNLLVYVEQTKDLSYMEEIISLLKEACSGGDPRQAALSYACLARAYLIPSTPFFDSHAAVMVLREATENISEPVDLINVILQLRLLGLPQLHARDMLGIYSTIVSNLPRLSNATMSPKIRLKTLSASTAIGGASLLCAVLVGELQTGVELLENSRALFWSQALNMRDPQLEDLPSDLRVEIEYLFGALSSTPALVHENHLTPRDVLHRQNERLQSLIAEVRALPGHAHFMLGTSYEQLASAFSTTAIVIFSADMGGCRAIITTGTHSQPAHLQLHELAAEELEDLNNHLTNLGMRVGRTETSREDDGRTLGISKRRDGDSRVERLLSKLWVKVMQPVLSALNYRTVRTALSREHNIF